MILLVIDTQKGITDERLFEFEKFKSNVGTLIAAARENGVEVVYYVDEVAKALGKTLGYSRALLRRTGKRCSTRR